jgi:hypothetical protein
MGTYQYSVAEVEQKPTNLVQIGRFGACARKRLLPRHTLKATDCEEKNNVKHVGCCDKNLK